MSLYEFYMRMSSNGRAPASQAGDAGSIPVIRSKIFSLNLQVMMLYLVRLDVHENPMTSS